MAATGGGAGATAVDGAQGAILLDANGERVVESGERRERLRLIGAYQGIALSRARDVRDRYATGEVRHIVCQYTDGSPAAWHVETAATSWTPLGTGCNGIVQVLIEPLTAGDDANALAFLAACGQHDDRQRLGLGPRP